MSANAVNVLPIEPISNRWSGRTGVPLSALGEPGGHDMEHPVAVRDRGRDARRPAVGELGGDERVDPRDGVGEPGVGGDGHGRTVAQCRARCEDRNQSLGRALLGQFAEAGIADAEVVGHLVAHRVHHRLALCRGTPDGVRTSGPRKIVIFAGKGTLSTP